YQFDIKRFSRDHFMKGYFDFDKDGFGPVFMERDAVIAYITEIVEKNNRNSYSSRTGSDISNSFCRLLKQNRII
ncbi:MAG: hypothetical protein II082_04585, partial [Ruminococcus sp.]|nr:hypothetical protein [Ruminococcus sp.]